MRMDNVLIIAPHNDDEILGCGGVISKFLSKGINVFITVVTNGHLGAPELFSKEGTEKLRKDALNAHQRLGVTRTIFLDFPAVKLDVTPGYQLSMAFSKIINELNIDTLFIPHRGDLHKDHRAVYEAALVSGRPVGSYSVKRIYTYETLSETDWAPPFGDDMFIPTIFIELSEDEMNNKIEALRCFQAPQLKEYPHARSVEGVKILAQYRGMTIGKPYAEAFSLVREVQNLPS